MWMSAAVNTSLAACPIEALGTASPLTLLDRGEVSLLADPAYHFLHLLKQLDASLGTELSKGVTEKNSLSLTTLFMSCDEPAIILLFYQEFQL